MTKILVVDDNKDFAELLSDLLSAHDYDVTVKHDGLQAINHLKEDANYDLVITDIIMPNSDGFDLIDFIKEELDLKVIAISGGGVFMSSGRVIDALVGMVEACLEKPVSMKKLLETVQRVLES